MQDKDVLLREYLSDEERFADLVNGLVFQGDRVIRPEDLNVKDSQMNGIHRLRRYGFTKRLRDVVKRAAFGVSFMVIGLENQSDVHYAMPLRSLSYDVEEYEEQLRAIKKKHRRKKDLKGSEFLSGMAETDRLSPALTIVLYYGEEPWDGPKSLHDMLDWKGIPEALKKMTGNYRMNLIEVRRFDRADLFHTDLKLLFQFIQTSEEKEEWMRMIHENEQEYMELEEDAFDLICALTGAEELEIRKETYRIKGGKINMCQALKELLEECRTEGMEIGLENMITACREFGISYQETEKKVIEKFGLSPDKSRDRMNRYWR